MTSPVDPTSTPAWAELDNLHRTMTVNFREWFAREPNRGQQFTLQAMHSYEFSDIVIFCH